MRITGPEGGVTIEEEPFSASVEADPVGVVARVETLGCRTDGVWRRLAPAVQKEHPAGFLAFSAVDNPDLGLSTTWRMEKRTLSLALTADEIGTTDWLSVTLAAAANEHFYGLGERFDSLDQRARVVDLRVMNGAQCGRTYKPIPFYISSAGYGLTLDTSTRTIIRFATPDDPDRVEIRIASPRVTITFYLDVEPRAILSHYTSSVGRPDVPPSWVFGPWKSRDWRSETYETVIEDVEAGRKNGLAGSVKVIDAAWETDSNSFIFDPRKFPDVAEMIDYIHHKGYRLVLWISPWMVKGETSSAVYRFCEENGFLIKMRDGGTYVHRLGNSPDFFGTCLDFTNPETVVWWKQQIKRLLELGVDGFKTDFGEQLPDDAVLFDGRRGNEVHNLYPLLYNRATYEVVRQVVDGVILERSAWTGCQSLSLIWAGDQTSDFAPASGFPSVILAGQSAGLSGFPFWTCDIGGYFGQPSEEAFVRWTEFAAFTPIMQIHGMGVREPWSYSAKVLDIYRRYAQLHLDLFPYLYAFAVEASLSGIPIMRALFLEFPHDTGIYGEVSEHQYMLGNQLLVSPVYSENARRKKVYLPEGSWLDFWTGEMYRGGSSHEVRAGLDEIPVFARAGALIPTLDGSPETLAPAGDTSVRVAGPDLRLAIFPGGDGEMTLADGTRFDWNERARRLDIRNGEGGRLLSVRVMGRQVSEVKIASSNDRSGDPRSGRVGVDGEYSRAQLSARATLSLQFFFEDSGRS